MADTIRTLEELQTLFADNETGEISPQDLRDFLVTAGLKNTAQTWTADQTIQNNLNLGVAMSQNGGIAINSASSGLSTITLVGNTGTIDCAVINASNLADIAFSGDYDDLSGDVNPNVPDAPASVTGNHVLLWNGATWAWVNIGAFDGSYASLTGEPTDPNPNIPDAPGSDGNFVLQMTSGDASWIGAPYAFSSHTHTVSDITDFPSLATVATTGSYNDLTDTPTLADVATSGSYSDLSGTPSLADVATSGSYTDLVDVPMEFPPTDHTHTVSDITDLDLATVATTGSYTDLINTPGVPTVPGVPATNYILHWNGSSWEWLSYAGGFVPSAPGSPNFGDRYELRWNGSSWEWSIASTSGDANPDIPNAPSGPSTTNYILNWNGSLWGWNTYTTPNYSSIGSGRYLLTDNGSGTYAWGSAREVPTVGGSSENLGQFLKADGSGGYAWATDYNPNVPDAPGGDGRYILQQSSGTESWQSLREVPAPLSPDDNDKVLRASSGNYSWATDFNPNIPDAPSGAGRWILGTDGLGGETWEGPREVPSAGSGEYSGQYVRADGSGGWGWATDYNPNVPDAPGSPSSNHNYILHYDGGWSWDDYVTPDVPGGVTFAESFLLHYDGSGNWSWSSFVAGAQNVPAAPGTDARYVLQATSSGTSWSWQAGREVPAVGFSNENLGQFLKADGSGGYAWATDYNPNVPNYTGIGAGRYVINDDGAGGYTWVANTVPNVPVSPSTNDIYRMKWNGSSWDWVLGDRGDFTDTVTVNLASDNYGLVVNGSGGQTNPLLALNTTGPTAATVFDNSGYGFVLPASFVLAYGEDADTGTNLTNVLIAPRNGKIVKAFAYAKTAPTGSSLIFDINKNGTSIWDSNPSNRLTIGDSSNSATPVTSFDTIDIAEGDIVTIDVDQIGSTIAGRDITVTLLILTRNQ